MIKLGNNNIGAIYLGGNKIGKAYLGNELVFQSGSSPSSNVVSYIRGGEDGSYIDTGITVDDTVKVIVWARNFNPASGFLFGSRVSAQQDTFCIGTHSGAAIGKIRLDYAQSNQTYTNEHLYYLSHYHKYEFYGGTLTIDDDVVATATSGTFSNQHNIHLFGVNTNGTHESMLSPTDICACEIYKNGTLVRNYTVVNSPSVGLYDSVSETLFTNDGGGEFTYGRFNASAYIPLEYISCNGSQYFNSGEYGTYSNGIVVKFMPTTTTPKWHSLLGYRATNNSCDISFGTSTSGQDNMRAYWRFGNNDVSTAAFSGATNNKLTNKSVIAVKSNATLTLYYNGSQIGTAEKTGVSGTFRTTYPMAIGAIRTGNTSYNSDEAFVGRIYYVQFGSGRSFVPAKRNNLIGMYDTYNNTFYESATNSPFIEGTII